MVRLLVGAFSAALLSSCATLPDWISQPSFLPVRADTTAGRYSFDWRLSGDRSVAPLQVFDNGKETWLQFAPGQMVPAIFSSTPLGERPLHYVRHGDYLILDGVWPRLRFRGGTLSADAWRMRPAQDNAVLDAGEPPASVPNTAHAADVVIVSDEPVRVVADGPAVNTDIARVDIRPAADDVRGPDSQVAPHHASTDVIPGVTAFNGDSHSVAEASLSALAKTGPYRVTLDDQNLRLALLRWAHQADWTFAPEHWTVDVDIPVSGEATFDTSFESSVQDLLAATELAERPLQPCFYSNRVLRVVSYAQACDRSGGARAS